MKETTLCYIENKNRYLMLLRNKKENDINMGKWIGIGGKLEKGETPRDCVLREIKEETSLEAIELKYRGKVNFISDTCEDEIMHLFTAKSNAEEFSLCGEGELCWIDKKDILSLNLWEGDKFFLKKLLEDAKEFFNLILIYKGESLERVIEE